MKLLLPLLFLLALACSAFGQPAKSKPAEARPPFEQALWGILTLENEGQFKQALEQCTQAEKTFTSDAAVNTLQHHAKRVREALQRDIELTAAVRGLTAVKGTDLEAARETLKKAGESGRMFLRKQTRSNEPREVEASGRMLIELGDRFVPDLFVERLSTSLPEELNRTLLDLAGAIPAHLEPDHFLQLCTFANRQGSLHTPAVMCLLDGLEALADRSTELKPVRKGRPDTDPRISLSVRLEASMQEEIIKALAQYIEKQSAERAKDQPAQGEADKQTVVRAEALLVHSQMPRIPYELAYRITRDPAPALAERWSGLLKQVAPQVDGSTRHVLAEYVARGGQHRLIAAEHLLDELERVAFVPPYTSASRKEQQRHLGALAPRIPEEDHPMISRALASFIERQAPENDERSQALVSRAGRILAESGFSKLPDLIATALQRDPNRPAAVQHVIMLERISHRVVELDRKLQPYLVPSLVRFMEKHEGAEATEASRTLVRTAGRVIEECQLPLAPSQLISELSRDAKRPAARAIVESMANMPRAYETMDPKYLPELVNQLTTFAVHHKEQEPALAHAQVVLDFDCPQVPEHLAAKLRGTQPGPALDWLRAQLQRMPGRLPPASIKALADHARHDSPNQAATAGVLVHVLQHLASESPAVKESTSAGRGKYDLLPSRLDRDIHTACGTALQAFVLKQATLPEEQRDPEYTRATTVLQQGRFPGVATRLASALVANPKAPVAKAVEHLLAPMADQTDASAVSRLADYVKNGGPHELVAARLLQGALEERVSFPVPGGKAKDVAVEPEKLRAHLEPELHRPTTYALLGFLKRHGGTKPRKPEVAPMLSSFEKLLGQGGLPGVPALMIKELVADPNAEKASLWVKLLKHASANIEPDELQQLVALSAKGEGATKRIIGDLVLHIMTEQQK